MNARKALSRVPLTLAALWLLSGSLPGQDLKTIDLLKPQTDGGKPLMWTLKERQTKREISSEKLPPQVLANLLWSGFGVNRPESGGRTAPSAMNSQEVDIYVATIDGLYLYDAKGHQLKLVLAEDVRAKTGGQPFVLAAPVSLIYVADFSRMPKARDQDREFYSALDAGFQVQNVYLYCASEGLATVVHEIGDRPALGKTMRLRSDQKLIIAQAVGWPKK